MLVMSAKDICKSYGTDIIIEDVSFSVNKGDKVKIIEREGTSSYSYIIDPAVAMSGCFAARYRIKSEYGIVKDIRENSRGFYVIVDFDEDEPR